MTWVFPSPAAIHNALRKDRETGILKSGFDGSWGAFRPGTERSQSPNCVPLFWMAIYTLHSDEGINGLEMDVAGKSFINSSLQRLRLNCHQTNDFVEPSTVIVAMIVKTALHCPEIEELTLRVERTMGNRMECGAYRALGRLAKLKHLVLHMDPQGLRYSHPPFDNNYYRELLINYAIDEPLARYIFQTVTSTSQGKPALQNLRLHWSNNHFILGRKGNFVAIRRAHPRHWLCTNLTNNPEGGCCPKYKNIEPPGLRQPVE
ncbi:hypothetical protein FQN49_004713 [Arthroderma sp. PD_2]|nr:hypothetical protein FQN49_004713 [Arthroderma sp. PD_2]